MKAWGVQSASIRTHLMATSFGPPPSLTRISDDDNRLALGRLHGRRTLFHLARDNHSADELMKHPHYLVGPHTRQDFGGSTWIFRPGYRLPSVVFR